jgi:hypothetical protein
MPRVFKLCTAALLVSLAFCAMPASEAVATQWCVRPSAPSRPYNPSELQREMHERDVDNYYRARDSYERCVENERRRDEDARAHARERERQSLNAPRYRFTSRPNTY